MDKILCKELDTMIGKITIGTDESGVCAVLLPGRSVPRDWQYVSVLPFRCERAFFDYFEGKEHNIPLPISLTGTAFTVRVLLAALRIPYGSTVTYGQIAASIGCPGGARAAGSALSRNPLPILIPCHRVIPAGGGIGGYAGDPKDADEIKGKLLRLEYTTLKQDN